MFFKWLRQQIAEQQQQRQQQRHQQQQQQQQQRESSSPAQAAEDSLPPPVPPPSSAIDERPDGDDVDSRVEDRQHLTSLERFLSSRVPAQCAGCSRLIELSADNVTRSVQRWWKERTRRSGTKKVELACGLCCGKQSCHAVTCPCGSTVSTGWLNRHELKARVSGTRFVFNHCCYQGRLVAVWMLATATSQSQPSSTPSISSGPKETNNGTNAEGVGYARSEPILQRLINRKPPRINTPQEDSELMMLLELRFRLLARLLPNCLNDDMGLVAFMLARSDLLSWTADLLVNDSAEEIQKQYQLYDGLLDFIEALANHPATTQLVKQARSIYGDGGRLHRISFLKLRNIGSEANAVDTTGKSLESMLQAIFERNRKTLEYNRKHNLHRDATDNTIANMQAWDSRISKIVQTYRVKAVVRSMANLRIDPAPAIQTFADYHRENGLAEVSDNLILYSHHYNVAATKASTGQPPRQRMKRVIREITTLQSSLPEGVFVRHGSSRLDVLKFLIIGPKDTPYADGFFLFDMFLPLEFPQKPPFVRFRTMPCSTNHQNEGLNPNLYSSGYVCLSLLGTWSGEPWRPEQSTLLQVLVSIQSMIFCAEPYYNEPYRCKDDAKSQKYSKRIRQMTFDCAITPWIEATANAHGGKLSVARGPGQSNVDEMWKDVAVHYFGKDSEYR
ncbi:hypothetical protein PG997_014778 [Apiospora hydei]|uniref:UBC core domain-containing protein n=1 Tax=Apiospora hydei TaxID=1337664 RepID=A0ABR1UUS8_9PEZI